MSEADARLIGSAVSGFFFLLSMSFAFLSWRLYRSSVRNMSVRLRLQTRAESLAWISWSNLALQAFVVGTGLTIAKSETFVGVAIMLGFIVAILAVGYRQALRMTFFLFARADALLILEERSESEGTSPVRLTEPGKTEQFAKLVAVLSPEGRPDSEDGPQQPLLIAVQEFLNGLRK